MSNILSISDSIWSFASAKSYNFFNIDKFFVNRVKKYDTKVYYEVFFFSKDVTTISVEVYTILNVLGYIGGILVTLRGASNMFFFEYNIHG